MTKQQGAAGCFGCLSTIVIAFIAIAGVGAIFTSCSGPSEPTFNEFAGFRACETAVKSQLKAPSTAEFHQGTIRGAAPKFVLTGSVDAQNSFGASIRNQYICELSWNSGTDTYKVVDLGML